MDAEEAIRTRRTHKAYAPEPVDRATLEELLDLARWAPNHHLTNPWRFRVLGPGALGAPQGGGRARDRRQARPRADARRGERHHGRAIPSRPPRTGTPRRSPPTSSSWPRTRAGSRATGARRASCAPTTDGRRWASRPGSACSGCCTSERRVRSSASRSARRRRTSSRGSTEGVGSVAHGGEDVRIRLISLAITLLAGLALAPAASAAPTTFTVDNIGAGADAAPGDGDCATSGFVCTLRAAIEESNATGGGAPVHDRLRRLADLRDVGWAAGDHARRDLRRRLRRGSHGPAVRRRPRTPSTADLRRPDRHGRGRRPAGRRRLERPERRGDLQPRDDELHLGGRSASGAPTGPGSPGNLMGRRINGTSEGNGSAVRVTGRTQNGTLVNSATGNIIGGTSNATDIDAPACDAYCNTIVNSTQQGIDLVGVAAGSGPGDAPAGGDAAPRGGHDDHRQLDRRPRRGRHRRSGNQTAVKIGNSLRHDVRDVAVRRRQRHRRQRRRHRPGHRDDLRHRARRRVRHEPRR